MKQLGSSKYNHALETGASCAFERLCPALEVGLSAQQIESRVRAGAVNRQTGKLTPTIGRIVLGNTLSLFNVIIAFLAVIIVMVGYPRQILFVGVALSNTVMGIYQEIKAKRILDKLSVLAQVGVTVVRDGIAVSISQDDIVLDDVMRLSAGDQICADGVVADAVSLEVDESLLTGESDPIRKEPGDKVLSGSFVTGGQAHVRATAVGADSYANSLTAQAKKKNRRARGKLLGLLRLIIRVLTVVIIPLGLLLFYANYNRGEELSDAVLGSAAAMVGMIPSGLVLLTGITLMVGAINLARRRALVQSLPSIETLARVDVICLDKTGTITDGKLTFERMELQDGASAEWAQAAISELMGILPGQNGTSRVLEENFGSSAEWNALAMTAFSSGRKWGGCTFEKIGTYILGSPGIVLSQSGSPSLAQANRYAAQGYRVVCLAYSEQPIEGERLPTALRCAALLLLADSIRPDAADSFRYFAGEGVALKVISGDNPRAVGAVAARAGLEGTGKSVDMSVFGEDADFSAIVEENTIFGHATPRQKLELIRAIKRNGHTTCMTGDGVNDILAMRESDCSVAMVGGSGAARSACDFVLLSSSFGSMLSVLREGRRVINNIERVAALYLVNTVFSVLLALIYTFLPYPYPYAPLQLTPVNALTTGIPSFFLALQSNYDRPAGRFLSNIFEHAIPAALTIVFNALYIQSACAMFDIPYEETSTMVVFLAGVVGFFMLFRVAGHASRRISAMLWTMVAVFWAVFFIPSVSGFFMLEGLIGRNIFFYLPLLYFSYHIHGFLSGISRRLLGAMERFRHRGREQLPV